MNYNITLGIFYSPTKSSLILNTKDHKYILLFEIPCLKSIKTEIFKKCKQEYHFNFNNAHFQVAIFKTILIQSSHFKYLSLKFSGFYRYLNCEAKLAIAKFSKNCKPSFGNFWKEYSQNLVV